MSATAINKNSLAESIISQISAGTDIPVKLEYPEDDIPPAIAVVSVDSVTHVNTGDPGTFRAEISVSCFTHAPDDPDGEILAGMAAAVAASVTDLTLASVSPAPVGKVGNDTAFAEDPETRRSVTRFSLFFSL